MSTHEEIRQQREEVYGDPTSNFRNSGLQITGLLQQHYGIELPHPLPPHMVALIMTAIKSNRAATNKKFDIDNHVDGANYFTLAGEVDPRNPESKKED